jgi:hypothetical protein
MLRDASSFSEMRMDSILTELQKQHWHGHAKERPLQCPRAKLALCNYTEGTHLLAGQGVSKADGKRVGGTTAVRKCNSPGFLKPNPNTHCIAEVKWIEALQHSCCLAACAFVPFHCIFWVRK